MPNHVENELHINQKDFETSPQLDTFIKTIINQANAAHKESMESMPLKEILKSFFKDAPPKPISIIDTHFPMPDEIRDTVSPRDNPNWYDWALKNWGTKWGDYNTKIVEYDQEYKDQAFITFKTAWSPPVEAITKISLSFPDLQFRLTYFEQGMEFMGSSLIENGKITSESITKYYGSRGG